jgi:hypothetical protein
VLVVPFSALTTNLKTFGPTWRLAAKLSPRVIVVSAVLTVARASADTGRKLKL